MPFALLWRLSLLLYFFFFSQCVYSIGVFTEKVILLGEWETKHLSLALGLGRCDPYLFGRNALT